MCALYRGIHMHSWHWGYDSVWYKMLHEPVFILQTAEYHGISHCETMKIQGLRRMSCHATSTCPEVTSRRCCGIY